MKQKRSMRYWLLMFVFIATISELSSQNPIVPAGVNFADPSARVMPDGRLYVYGSLDESKEFYCSHNYHILSTPDLKSWEIKENVFSSKGINQESNSGEVLLYAPDCYFKNGIYYLYYCHSGKTAEGLAVGGSPTGPFSEGRKIELDGINEIDPAVFIDDDGQAYYIWGQFEAKIAKLKPNMMEIDTSTIVKDLVTEKEHFFHEGSFMMKRNGIYYLVYADISRGNRPTCIGYATSNSPMGPFKYRGVIVDNDNSDPSVWNNHGSIVQYKNQWYVFYHRSTHNSRMMRKACVEPIFFNEDGSIDEVEMTSQGAGAPLDAFNKIDAERACLLFGSVNIQLVESKNEQLTSIRNRDNVAYKYIDFKDGANQIQLRVKPLKNGGNISVRLDQPWGKKLGNLDITGELSGEWLTVSSDIKKTEGVHAVWLVFTGENDEMFEIDWFEFN